MGTYGATSLMRAALKAGGIKVFVIVLILLGITAFLIFIFREIRDYLKSKREEETKAMEHKRQKDDSFTQELLKMIHETSERNSECFDKAMKTLHDRDDKEDERHTKYIKSLSAIEALARSTNGKCSNIHTGITEIKGYIQGHGAG